MSILLICQSSSGTISLEAEYIYGIQVQERQYSIKDHQVILEGYPDMVLRHDMGLLLSSPGSLCRLPSPEEQDRFMQAQRTKGMIQE